MKFLKTGCTLVALIGLCCSTCNATEKIKSLCQFNYPSDSQLGWKCVQLTKKDTAYKVFGRDWEDGLRFNRMDRHHFIAGLSVKVPLKMEEVRGFTPMPKSYPEAAKEARFILINQNEMFLGAYEFGRLVFSTPIAVGVEGNRLENGSYRVDAVDRRHQSSLYPVEGTKKAYPMHYGLRFHIDKRPDGWTSYWLHGRDLPGYPASHGCIGLSDEEMQKKYYHDPARPALEDAKKLYLWVVGSHRDNGKFQNVRYGPKVLIMGAPSPVTAEPAKPAASPTAAGQTKQVASPAAAVVPVAGKPVQHP
jgi:hypothetical protein